MKTDVINYDEYHFTNRQIAIYLSEYITMLVILSYLFYHSVFPAVIISPFIILLMKMKKKELMQIRLNELAVQFKDAILAISAALHVGYSIENAFREAGKEMVILHGEKSIITEEFTIIKRRLEMNDTLEKILHDFSDRCKVDDVMEFVEVFSVAKRSGGNYISIIQTTADAISSKIEVKKEIDTFLSGKKYEQKILSFVPPSIIAFVDFSSPGFLNALYKNPVGIIIMTICLILYVGALVWGRKVTDIKL